MFYGQEDDWAIMYKEQYHLYQSLFISSLTRKLVNIRSGFFFIQLKIMQIKYFFCCVSEKSICLSIYLSIWCLFQRTPSRRWPQQKSFHLFLSLYSIFACFNPLNVFFSLSYFSTILFHWRSSTHHLFLIHIHSQSVPNQSSLSDACLLILIILWGLSQVPHHAGLGQLGVATHLVFSTVFI